MYHKHILSKRSICMKDAKQLESILNRLDGQKYGAYKQLKGIYQFNRFKLAIDHVQVDPFAPPSKMRIIMDRETAGIPEELLDTKDKVTAVDRKSTRLNSSHVSISYAVF